MKLKDRERIDRCVREYVQTMRRADSGYDKTVTKGLIVTEIFQSNGWFTTMPYTAEIIREEVEKQLNFYVGRESK